MRPLRGALVYKVPGSDGLALLVAPAAGSPSVSAPLVWRFPHPAFCDRLLVMLRPGPIALETQLARVSISIVDETNQPLISDSRGTLRGSQNAAVAAPLLLLAGFALHPFPLQRPVAAHDRWIFTLQNEDPANVATLAGIFLQFKDAT